MTARLDEIAARRRALGERSAALRDALAADTGALRSRFKAADRLIAAARSGAGRALLVGGAAFVALGRPRRVFALALRVLALWPLVSAVVPRLRDLFRSPKSSP